MSVGRFKGFGPLKIPVDLFEKIRHDFARLRDAPRRVYRFRFRCLRVPYDAFQVDGLFVELDGQPAAMYGARLEAMDLAEKVLTHWEADPRLC
jgi:hypothetical protein